MKTDLLSRCGLGLLAGVTLALSAGAAQAATSLTVWTDVVRLPQLQDYQTQHSDVTLNIVTVSPDDLVAKLQVLMKAHGDIPDLIWMSDPNQESRLVTRLTNYLMDLTSVVPKDVQDKYYPNANVPCWINGKLVCLRDNISHDVIWYNQPLFDKLGKKVPTTWEEFEQLGADIAALKQGYFLGTGGDTTVMTDMLVAGGCPFVVPVEGKADTLKIDVTDDSCKRPAKMIDDMLANGSLIKDDPFSPTFTSAAVDGKLLMEIGPTWFGEFVMKPAYKFPPKSVGIAIPMKWSDQAQPITWSWGGGTWGIWKDTKEPKAAEDLLMWLATDPGNQAKGVTMSAYQPASLAWGAKLKSDGYYTNDDPFGTLVAAAAFSSPNFISLRFSAGEAISKIVTPALAAGGKLVDQLPALQTEMINEAKVAGYTIEN